MIFDMPRYIITRTDNRGDTTLSPQGEDFRYVLALLYAIKVFGEENKARQWLTTSNYAMGDVIPYTLLSSAEGLDQVLSTLGRIESGIFA